MPPANRFRPDGLARWDRGAETLIAFDPFRMRPHKAVEQMAVELVVPKLHCGPSSF